MAHSSLRTFSTHGSKYTIPKIYVSLYTYFSFHRINVQTCGLRRKQHNKMAPTSRPKCPYVKSRTTQASSKRFSNVPQTPLFHFEIKYMFWSKLIYGIYTSFILVWMLDNVRRFAPRFHKVFLTVPIGYVLVTSWSRFRNVVYYILCGHLLVS